MPGISLADWDTVADLIEAALERDPDDRHEYVRQACAGDQARMAMAERLLVSAEAAATFFELPAAVRVSDLLSGAIFAPRTSAPILEATESERAAGLPSREEVYEGRLLGPYRLLRRLGRGGMGEVVLAEDARLDRPVAIKLLPPWLAGDERARKRLVREARVVSALDHPSIATVYDIGETEDGRPFIAMAYYAGRTLRERLRDGALAIEEAIHIATRLADALGAAHARGITHRDLKPENVILTPEGGVKLLDFGIARMLGSTGTGTFAAGTVAYMSPEQTRGHGDARSDVWSLGVVLYEMLAGSRPFVADGAEALIHAIRHDGAPAVREVRPETPAPIAELIQRCLAKDPAARPVTALEVAASLTDPGSARTISSSARSRTSPFTRRRIALLAILGTAVAAGLLLLRPGPRASVEGARTIAVLPLVPVRDDSALSRLGRELAVTLAARLDGAGAIRTVDPLTILSRVNQIGGSAARVATELGAGSAVDGTLMRTDVGVRLDMTFREVLAPESGTRFSVIGNADDIAALTDSAALALLREVWRVADVPAPSPTAITTRSVPALRAYLQGELAMARAEFETAVRAFEAAFQEDSTFWFAYWRSVYPRVYEGTPASPVILDRIWEHRHGFPEPDRLLLESGREPAVSARIATLRTLTERFPNYWPGWQARADHLVHWAPYLGGELADARPALERLLSLQPEDASGWEHLLWIDLLQRDTVGARQRVQRLARFSTPGGRRVNPDQIRYYGLLADLARRNDTFSDESLNEQATFVARYAGSTPALAFGYGLLDLDFPRGQTQLAEAALARSPNPAMAAAMHLGRGLGLAARGGWTDALAALDRWVETASGAAADPTPDAALLAYGFAVVAARLGEIPIEGALARRARALRSAGSSDPEGRAELAWLDGVLAHARADVAGLAVARDSLRRTQSEFKEVLERSLSAFARDLEGESEAAGVELAALEWDGAETQRHHRSGRRHPFLNSVNRLAASRLLLAAGDTLTAHRLLTWSEAVLWNAQRFLDPVNRVLHSHALLARARIEEARGLHEAAGRHYRAFVDRYDRATGPSTAAVNEAVAALGRLSGKPSR